MYQTHHQNTSSSVRYFLGICAAETDPGWLDMTHATEPVAFMLFMYCLADAFVDRAYRPICSVAGVTTDDVNSSSSAAQRIYEGGVDLQGLGERWGRVLLLGCSYPAPWSLQGIRCRRWCVWRGHRSAWATPREWRRSFISSPLCSSDFIKALRRNNTTVDKWRELYTSGWNETD